MASMMSQPAPCPNLTVLRIFKYEFRVQDLGFKLGCRVSTLRGLGATHGLGNLLTKGYNRVIMGSVGIYYMTINSESYPKL